MALHPTPFLVSWHHERHYLTGHRSSSPAVEHLHFGLTTRKSQCFFSGCTVASENLQPYQPFGVEHRVERVQDVGEGHVGSMVRLPWSSARISTRPRRNTPKHEDVAPRSRRLPWGQTRRQRLALTSEEDSDARGGRSRSCSALQSRFGAVGFLFGSGRSASSCPRPRGHSEPSSPTLVL